MRLLHFAVPGLVLAVSACAPPPPEAFDKLPVGATTAAIDARRAAQAGFDAHMASAPIPPVMFAEPAPGQLPDTASGSEGPVRR
jgi:hypothetical protein